MGELNPEMTDKRKLTISFNFPFFSRYKVIYTEITQLDLLKMIRVTNKTDLHYQLIRFIEAIDKNSEYETDITGQKINRARQLVKSDRLIIDIDKRVEH